MRSYGSTAHRVMIWQGGDPEWAICTGAAVKPPKHLCFLRHPSETMQFINRLRSGAEHTVKTGSRLVHRWRRKRLPQVNTYFDFSYPTAISTNAAVVLAAEYERLRMVISETPHTVDLHRWNEDVFRKLYQIGFFEIVGITPERPDVIIDEGSTRTMRIISMNNANDLAKVDAALLDLGVFMGLDGQLSEHVIIDLLTGLSEAISNVTNHAYPSDYRPEYPHVGKLWVSATADRDNQTLTVVVYDQGVTIPVTYPRISRGEQVMNFLGRALRQKRSFDFQDDGTYVRASMKYGGSRTDKEYRGKGLPQMIEMIDRVGRGTITVVSRGGWCRRDLDGRYRSGAVPFSIDGTMVEWEVELSQAGVVQ